MAVTEDRNEVGRFAAPVFLSHLLSILSKPIDELTSSFDMFGNFTVFIWLLIMVAFSVPFFLCYLKTCVFLSDFTRSIRTTSPERNCGSRLSNYPPTVNIVQLDTFYVYHKHNLHEFDVGLHRCPPKYLHRFVCRFSKSN